MRWLSAEPYRIFFVSGALFSIVGVLLWPLFYMGWLLHYPGLSHARIMVECFGGGFMIGLVGITRPLSSLLPPPALWRFGPPLLLQLACGVAHLANWNLLGDLLFFAFLFAPIFCLSDKNFYSGSALAPPSLLFDFPGIICASCAVLLELPSYRSESAAVNRLASLLFNQGFLLCPILSASAFLIRRHLREIGLLDDLQEERSGEPFRSIGLITLGVIGSIIIEAFWSPLAGIILRTFTAAFAFRFIGKCQPVGTLPRALTLLCFPFVVAGIAFPAWSYVHHVPLNHLLFIGGYGLFALIVATYVLLDWNGESNMFIRNSLTARWVVGLLFVTALTRASADFSPRILISHLIYASTLWTAAVILWLVWQLRRLFSKGTRPDVR